MRVWYLSHKLTSKDQTRFHIGAVSTEPLRIAVKRSDVDQMKAQANFIGQFKKVWYLSHMRAVANQARLHICAVLPGPLQISLKRRDVDEGLVKL